MGQQRRYDDRPRGNPETDEGRDQRSGLIILQKAKDAMKYLYTSWVKYPRSEKLGFVSDYKKGLFEAGKITFEKVNNTMQSYFGLIQHFTAGNLLRKIIDEFSFRIFNNL